VLDGDPVLLFVVEEEGADGLAALLHRLSLAYWLSNHRIKTPKVRLVDSVLLLLVVTLLLLRWSVCR
jgi:hypothetical protein